MTKLHPSEKAYKEVCKILSVKAAKITEKLKDVPNATLVIVPNDIFSWDEIKGLAVAFGETQPRETSTYDALYKRYTPEQLSGEVITKKAYRYLYIPEKYNVEADTLANQKKNTGHVPSVLEAVCFWFALRQDGKPLTFDRTYIRHFDLPEQRVDVWLFVPYSYVGVDGGPYLFSSFALLGDHARVAVGAELKPQPSSSPLELSEEQAIKLLKGKGYEVWRKL